MANAGNAVGAPGSAAGGAIRTRGGAGRTNAAIKSFVVIVALVVVLAGLLWGFYEFNVGSMILLPILVIGGVLALLVALGIVAVVFASYDLDDKTQALALPEGSIRAVIALSLIILFAILSIYLYGSLSSGSVIEHVSKDMRDTMLQNPAYHVIGSTSTGDDFSVTIQGSSSDAVDFAKQLLAQLATLVAAISAFYFGSRIAVGAASGQSAPAGAPTVASLRPTSHDRDGSQLPILVAGSNLSAVTGLKIKQGSNEVAATDLHAGDTSVAGTLLLASDMATGSWDLVAEYGAGNALTLPGALTITAPPAAEGEVSP